VRAAALFAVLLLAAPVQAKDLVDADPEDSRAVYAVCAGCHPNTAFLESPRSWQRWNDVFAQMVERGASGTDEQLERVTRYFLENLTVVNVNTSPIDEIGPVLGVTRAQADAIIARRTQRPFASWMRSLVSQRRHTWRPSDTGITARYGRFPGADIRQEAKTPPWDARR
jgi:hypothetical protein